MRLRVSGFRVKPAMTGTVDIVTIPYWILPLFQRQCLVGIVIACESEFEEWKWEVVIIVGVRLISRMEVTKGFRGIVASHVREHSPQMG